jgi:hypothetical protein
MHVWNWFRAMSVTERGNNGFSPLYLKSADIEAWLRLRGYRARGWEIEALSYIDRAFMLHMMQMAEREKEKVDDTNDGSSKK